MMGIRFKTSSGGLQIDTRYKNVSLCDHSTVSGIGKVSVLCPRDCVIAVRPSARVVFDPVPHGGGVMWTFRVFQGDGSSSTQLELEYFIFGPPSAASPASGYGVRIHNPDGGVVFDSRLPYMSIQEVLAFPSVERPMQSTGQITTTGSYAYQNKIAVVCNDYPYDASWLDYSLGPNSSGRVSYETFITAGTVHVSGNTVIFSKVDTGNYYRNVPEPSEYPIVMRRKGSPIYVINVEGM